MRLSRDDDELRTARGLRLAGTRETVLRRRAERRLIEVEFWGRLVLLGLVAVSTLLAVLGALIEPRLVYGAVATVGACPTLVAAMNRLRPPDRSGGGSA